MDHCCRHRRRQFRLLVARLRRQLLAELHQPIAAMHPWKVDKSQTPCHCLAQSLPVDHFRPAYDRYRATDRDLVHLELCG